MATERHLLPVLWIVWHNFQCLIFVTLGKCHHFFRFLGLCPKCKIMLPKMLDVVIRSLRSRRGEVFLFERPSKAGINSIAGPCQTPHRSLQETEPHAAFTSVPSQSPHTENNF